MSTINLNNLSGIPANLLEKLKGHEYLFKESIFLEHVLEDFSISSLVREIDTFCFNELIYGFHYTRAIPEEILVNGLSCRTGAEIRETFMSKYSTFFTNDEMRQIKEKWNSHFDVQQQKTRDNCLFFNFTTCALNNYGAESLLSNFGGEQVYMPLQDLFGIGEKIKKIGTPLILKCVLNPFNLKTFFEYPLGRIAVSTYHRSINPNAIQFDQDGFQFANVKPSDIEIFYYNNFTDFTLI